MRDSSGMRSYSHNKSRAHNLKYARDYTLSLKIRVFRLFGNKCNRCGFLDWRALQVDHINNNGSTDKSLSGFRITGRDLWSRVLKCDGVGFQLLCANCNVIKEFERRGYIDEARIEKVIEIL